MVGPQSEWDGLGNDLALIHRSTDPPPAAACLRRTGAVSFWGHGKGAGVGVGGCSTVVFWLRPVGLGERVQAAWGGVCTEAKSRSYRVATANPAAAGAWFPWRCARCALGPG